MFTKALKNSKGSYLILAAVASIAIAALATFLTAKSIDSMQQSSASAPVTQITSSLS